MNKERRKNLAKIIEQLENLSNTLDELKSEEEDYFDNMPENLQYNSDRGERAQDAISSLENAYNSINEAIDNISEAIE